MFFSWGRFVAIHRRAVSIVAILILFVAVGIMATVSPDLSSEGFISEDAESARVDRTVVDQFGQGGDSLVFLFDLSQPPTDPAMQSAVETALAPIATDGRFQPVLTTWNTGDSRFVANDGTSTYAVAQVKPGIDFPLGDVEGLVDEVTTASEAQGLPVMTGGSLTIGNAITDEVEKGIVRAETVAIPLTILIQILVFGSVVAAGLPLLIGALGIVLAIGLVFLISQDIFASVFAINIITMLGLGLGIDYSLFMVTRFREEIQKRSAAEAIAVTMATTGKAILFSGITVMFGLAATRFFPLPALQSMGEAGIIVTATALLFGLTLLPALLVMLGDRVNSLSVFRRKNRPEQVVVGAAAVTSAENGFWFRLANVVMRRPLAFLIPLLIALLVAGIPMLQIDLTPGGPEVLPKGQEPRIVNERITSEFPGGPDTLPVLITFTSDPLSESNVAEVQRLTAEFTTIEHVTSVDSFATTPALTQATVRGDQVLIQVHSNASSAELEQVARDLRATTTNGGTLEVGGQAAAAVDTVDGIMGGIIPAALFVLIGAYIILLFTFGSVFLPLKAIFMSLLSISASLGILVLVFQHGYLEGLLGFTATGEIVAVIPVLMFCILFGLSMDYEVLMLSRIQEEYERTGDNRASVAFGLAHTGRVITGAAGIMIVAFGGFMLADIVIIKSLGFGLALAVLIDATIVRGLLVPSTMRLMGHWNWWAPAPVKRIVDRAGLSHHSDLPEMRTSTGRGGNPIATEIQQGSSR